jgi:hypothetical protein
VPDAGFVDESGVDLYGHFSPRVRDNSTGVAPVVQVMPKLQEMCGEPVVPLSDEKAKVVSLEISNEALSSHVLDFKESGDVVLPKSIGHVVPVGDVVATSLAAARVPGSLVAKEICDFFATLAAANPRSSKTIGCLLKEKVNKDKSKKGGTMKNSNKCRRKKSGAMEKVYAVA